MQQQTVCRVLLACAMVGGAATALRAQAAPGSSTAMLKRPALIPWPTSVELSSNEIALTRDTVIEVTPGQADLWRLATDLAQLLRPALDATIAIRDSAGPPAAGTIRLEIVPATTALAGDGYDLTLGASGIRIAAATPAGVFYGTQTLRQLLPWAVELRGPRPFAVSVPSGHITDRPRYEWRGVFLDVSRHFFSVADVKRYIDLSAMYKMNRLHLHLSDDQGWRIEIASWPNLTRHGGSTAVGRGAGGYYTKADFAEIVAYARDRFMMLIPEIEMPSHCNAALASYPELTCDGVAPPLYTGIEVGFSNFCFDKDITFKFLDDVIRELAAMTPGPYIHIGGDEVKTMTPAQYSGFMERAQAIVARHGKTAIAWDEVIHGKTLPSTVVQYWRPDASLAPPPGTKLILSPANRLYLDMKYNDTTVLGLNWAGNVDVDAPYEWDPARHLNVPESSILGVETTIWSETTATIRDLEFLLFPRLPAVAELAWSAQAARSWSDFRVRLGAQAPGWSALGINAFWSPKIEWTR